MSVYLFRKNIEKSCGYCLFATELAGGTNLLCRRKGVLENDGACRRFKYDPIKRKPKKTKIQAFKDME